MKKSNPNKNDYIMQDKDGNQVPAFEVDEQKNKKKVLQTSTGYTVFAVILYVLTFLPIAGVTLVLAMKTRSLMPYYSFWPFFGVIVIGVLAMVFYLVLILVARKNTKRTITIATIATAAFVKSPSVLYVTPTKVI